MIAAAAGGALVGLAASLLLLLNGRVAGISGILNGGLEPGARDRAWRIAFLAGMPVGAMLAVGVGWAVPALPGAPATPWLVAGGVLVGYGTRLGSGCTSGHGVCGIAPVGAVGARNVHVHGDGHRHGVRGAPRGGPRVSGAREIVAALVAGVLFGVGLAVSGMIHPAKVLGFLDVAGAWDPSLLAVMGAAVPVSFMGYRLTRGREQPWIATAWHLPTRRDIDAPLLAGAAIFGVGWGLGGFCPGPALASLASLGLAGRADAWIFVAALIAGSLLRRSVERRGRPARESAHAA